MYKGYISRELWENTSSKRVHVGQPIDFEVVINDAGREFVKYGHSSGDFALGVKMDHPLVLHKV